MKAPRFITALGLLLSASLHASDPTVDSVDYTQPDRYLAIAPSLGSADRISGIASDLEGSTDLDTIENVLEWMEGRLAYDGDLAYAWRNFDHVIDSGAYGGCADQGIACGALLKAAGIPTVWVKTMDVDWIWDFKKGRPFRSWSGHVFLEVHVDGHWMLLDPGSRTIHREYSPRSRILPGNRFAYHKGDDPKAMIMSLQWEDWKKQSTAYFTALDESLLPVDPAGGTMLASNQAWVIGNSPYYQKLTELARAKGYTLRLSFNTAYDRHLPEVRGHTLLVETHGNRPVVPVEVLDRHFPKASEGLRHPDRIAEVEGTTIAFFDFDDDQARKRAEEVLEKKTERK